MSPKALSRLTEALTSPSRRTLIAHLADASSTWAKHWSIEENCTHSSLSVYLPCTDLLLVDSQNDRYQAAAGATFAGPLLRQE